MKIKRQFMPAVQSLAERPIRPPSWSADPRRKAARIFRCDDVGGRRGAEKAPGLPAIAPQGRPKKHEPQLAYQNKSGVIVRISGDELVRRPVPIGHLITLPNALRVKSAEYWLKLGEPHQALMELGKLSRDARNHPWILRVHLAAIGAVREMNRQEYAE